MSSRSPAIRIDPTAEEQELRAYLGDRFDYGRLQRHEEEMEAELGRIGDEQLLYRSSEAYLYNLTVFAMSGTKLPYLRQLARFAKPGARVLDYGCGIGSDGLLLLGEGYDVSFADYDNPSTHYLRWRLERRGWSAPIYDLDRGEPPGGFDVAYAFDVIEHVDDPFDFLKRLEAQARAVLVNFLEPEPGETALHRVLPVRRLIEYAAGHRLRHYRRYHRRSHLVLYDRELAQGLARARSRVALSLGRIR